LTSPLGAAPDAPISARASTEHPGFAAGGALEHDRFSLAPASMWKGAAGENSWWWQADFAQPRKVGAILQVLGEHDFVLRNAPRRYVWQWRTSCSWPDNGEKNNRTESRLRRRVPTCTNCPAVADNQPV